MPVTLPSQSVPVGGGGSTIHCASTSSAHGPPGVLVGVLVTVAAVFDGVGVAMVGVSVGVLVGAVGVGVGSPSGMTTTVSSSSHGPGSPVTVTVFDVVS